MKLTKCCRMRKRKPSMISSAMRPLMAPPAAEPVDLVALAASAVAMPVVSVISLICFLAAVGEGHAVRDRNAAVTCAMIWRFRLKKQPLAKKPNSVFLVQKNAKAVMAAVRQQGHIRRNVHSVMVPDRFNMPKIRRSVGWLMPGLANAAAVRGRLSKRRAALRTTWSGTQPQQGSY